MNKFYKNRNFITRKIFNIFKIEKYWRKGYIGWEGHIGITSHNKILQLFINFRPSDFYLTFSFNISKAGISIELALYAHMQIHILFFKPKERYDDENYADDL